MTELETRKASPAKKKSSALKTLILIFGSIFGLFVLAAILIPLFVDVDKYRPMIVSKANEQINGKVELGKLGLSLWGRVRITVDGLKVTDRAGRPVVQVQDASFNLPLLSLISGSPEVRIRMVNPEINIIKQMDGKMNAMTLMKPSAAAPAPAPSQPSTKPSESKDAEIPAIALRSRITVLFEHAKLAYKDEVTKDSYNVNDLNFSLRDVSPSRRMPFEVTANLDMTMQKTMRVTGPLSFRGSAQAYNTGGTFEKADFEAYLSLDDLDINQPGTFHKKKGVALGADMKGTVAKDSFQVPMMKFRFADVTIDGKASGHTMGETTSIDFSAKSNRIDIAKLGDLASAVKEYNLNGLLELAVAANGPTNKLNYSADMKFNKITLTHESMKQPLEVNGSMSVITDQLKDLTVKLTAKDFDLGLKGSMQNFMKPRFQFALNSTNMDVDGLLKATAKAAEQRKEAAKSQSAGAPPSKAPAVDYNAMFKPLRENPVVAGAAGTFDFNLKRIKATGVVITETKGQLALNNLLLALKNFSMQIFGGSVKGDMSFNAKAAKPEVGTNINATGIDTQKMVESQMPFARNTMKGVISSSLNVGGSGLNEADINSNWKGNGHFDIKDAVFSTVDIGKQIKENVVAKLPDFAKSKAKIPDSLANWRGEYEKVLMKFALANGVFNMNEITGKAYPNKGMDLKGAGTVKLTDYALEMNIDLIDTYDMLSLDQAAPDQRYGHFALSAPVRGTAFAPKIDWTSAVGKLAQNAVKAQAKQKVQETIKQKAPEGVKSLKKLFGR